MTRLTLALAFVIAATTTSDVHDLRERHHLRREMQLLDCNRTRRSVRNCLLPLLMAVFALSSVSWATAKETPTVVDLELVVAVDVSSSMDQDELRVQREGYALALRSPEVMQAIKSGRWGRIAFIYFEWANPDYQLVRVPWTVIDGPDDTAEIANAIEKQPIISQGGTSISAALSLAGKLLRTSGLQSDRRIIDVSGDGPNNSGPSITPIRDALVAQGTTINGLAISLSISNPPNMTPSYDLRTLKTYYEHCVIGGFGAFVHTICNPADFERAICQKFVDEIAGLSALFQLVSNESLDLTPADC